VGPLAVDPQALFAVGSAVVAAGEGLAANLTVLTAGFAANTGHDAAGEVFGLGYQDAAESLLKASAAAINACRQSGALIQQGAANYSKAEAASTLGGGGDVLGSPPEPAKISAPGPPGTLGPGPPPPLLWAVVQSFVDDVWPDGDAAGIHAAAARWRGFGAAAGGMRDALNSAMVLLDAHQIPEGGKIDVALSQIRDSIAQIGDASGKLATGLDTFANEVSRAQNSIRDLLNRLGSLTDLGHDLMLIVKGDALDEIKKIAKDVNDVLHNLGREARATEQAVRLGLGVIDGLVVKLEKFVRGELKEFLGDPVGNQVATVFDFFANANEGVLKGAVGMALSIGDLDPRWFVLDPKGAASTWGDLGKSLWKGSLFNALLNPQEAGETQLQQLKGLLHLDDWSTARPGLGLGENVFDVATLLIPGGGEAGAAADGAGAAARGAEAAADAERAAGRGAEGIAGVAGPRGALADIAGKGSSLTKDLEGVTGKLPKIDPPVGGQPVALPPKPLEAPVAPAPRAPDAAPGAPREPGAPEPGEIGGPHDPAGAAPAPAHASPGGPHDPAGGPHEPVSAPAPAGGDGPHDPVSAPVGGPREPIPATAPASHPPTVPAAAAERAPSTMPQLLDHSSAPVQVSPNGAPVESAPAAAHSSPSEPSPSSATPHSALPGGRPSELPGGSGWQAPGESAPPGGPPHGTPPHAGPPHGPADVGPPRGVSARDPSEGRPPPHGPDDGSLNEQGSHERDDTPGEIPNADANAPAPPIPTKVPGVDYALPAADALRVLERPGAEIDRLVEGGVPHNLLHGYEPLAGRTLDEFEREFTIEDPNGNIRWDWDVQAPNNGFAGEPMPTDRIPTNLRLDRLGPNGGGFLSPEGTPLPERATPPGLANQYHIFEGTGQPIPAGKNWEVQFGPAKDAFGQPGGGEQWVVVDKATDLPVSVDELKDAGMLSEPDRLEDTVPRPETDEPDEPN
jgi:Tuberculosis necrotizing toxin